MNRIIALVLIILLLPLLCLVSLVIFFDDGFPIIYIQRKLGENHKPFDLYKFRTMKRNTPEMPTEEFNQPEKYLLISGQFLRKYSIDELPQFFNVIQGKINFIGPRPCMSTNEDVIKKRREELGIHTLKPGITGLAQVNGRDKNSYEQKISLDKKYMENKSFLFNLRILYKTFSVVLFPKDIKH
jgi:O-antigen biosynthesis protein WbqP